MYRTYNAIAVLEDRTLHFEDGNKRILTTNDLLIYTFELIENEIDIDSIEKLESITNNIDGTVCIMNKINELVQAVKQINKEVKELENRK